MITIRINTATRTWATFNDKGKIIGEWNRYEDIGLAEKAGRKKARLMGCEHPEVKLCGLRATNHTV